MRAASVPFALRERLGSAGAVALEETLNERGEAWRDDVLTMAEERFERRMAQELGRFSVQMTEAMALLRCDLHREIQTSRVELLKWSFLFWVGQVVAVGGLLALMP